ncbi:hypothetical protein O9993_01240 [Vibrio lentus]|nr:hypothetical protein [Vibrio lentus]
MFFVDGGVGVSVSSDANSVTSLKSVRPAILMVTTRFDEPDDSGSNVTISLLPFPYWLNSKS